MRVKIDTADYFQAAGEIVWFETERTATLFPARVRRLISLFFGGYYHLANPLNREKSTTSRSHVGSKLS